VGPGDACCRGFSGEYQKAEIALIEVLVTLWTKGDLIFIPERCRLHYTLILRIYCWTEARLVCLLYGKRGPLAGDVEIKLGSSMQW
jgi:hypothetical protein